MAYRDWCTVQNLLKSQKTLTPDIIDKVQDIKSQFNSKGKHFYFSDLNSIVL